MSALLAPMSQEEAITKHAQLKNLGSVMRGLLLEMRDRKGYVALGFSTFEDYGEQEWGYTKSYINRLANAAEIQSSLSPIGDKELPESQLRPLSKIPKADRDAIYQDALQKAKEEGKELTAKMVQEAVAEHLEKLNQAQLTIDGLEQSITDKADKIANEKIEVQKAEMQQQLDALVAKTEQESQDAISALNLTINRLTQQLNEANTPNKPTTISELKSAEKSRSDAAELEKKIAEATNRLNELKEQALETEAALYILDIESQASVDAKSMNHALYGAVMAIHTDIDERLKQIQSWCYTDNNATRCYYPLTEKTSNTFLEVARVLKRMANEFESIAQPSTDQVDDDFSFQIHSPN